MLIKSLCNGCERYSINGKYLVALCNNLFVNSTGKCRLERRFKERSAAIQTTVFTNTRKQKCNCSCNSAFSLCLQKFSFLWLLFVSKLPHFLRPPGGKSAKQTLQQLSGIQATRRAAHQEIWQQDIWVCARVGEWKRKNGAAFCINECLQTHRKLESGMRKSNQEMLFTFSAAAAVMQEKHNMYIYSHSYLSQATPRWNLRSWHSQW